MSSTKCEARSKNDLPSRGDKNRNYGYCIKQLSYLIKLTLYSTYDWGGYLKELTSVGARHDWCVDNERRSDFLWNKSLTLPGNPVLWNGETGERAPWQELIALYLLNGGRKCD